jgi:hypothetical protein
VTATMENDAHLIGKQGDEDPPRPFQISSYLDLLQFPDIPDISKDIPSGARDVSVPVVDAIIIPTVRSAEQLSSAVELASRAGCQLLVLYTDRFPSGLLSVLDGLRDGKATPLAIRVGLSHHLIDLGANLPQSLVSSAAFDISRKRNLGLLIGRMHGWTRMLLLDDDIRRLSIEKLSAAALLLDRYPVIGLEVTKYPDASVVGHARRLTGRRQEPFVSGGSLLINPQRLNGFFPAIYHEDWLCIINHLRLGEVAIGGRVGQLPYKPFTSPARARHEEFGDILASGLLWLVHSRTKMSAMDVMPLVSDKDYWSRATKLRFWEQILEQRAEMLDEIAGRLTMLNLQDPSPLPSVEAARQRCNELAPDEFVAFTKAWVKSLGIWRERVSRLPQVDSVEKAISELGMWDVVRSASAVSARQLQAKRLTAGSAAVVVGGLAGAALGAITKLRNRTNKASLLRGRNRGSRLGRLVRGRGPGCRIERPPAGSDNAENHDCAAAGSK